MVTTTVARPLRAVVVGSVLFGGTLSVSVLSGSLPAGATTTVQLYVAKGGAGSACTETSPCRHIGRALELALTETGDNVVITVAGGTYNETDPIDASSLESLSLQGAGASSTIVDGGGNGKVFAISAGTVSLSGFTIEKGLASGSHRGGGVSNAGSLTVSDTVFSSDRSQLVGGAIFNKGSLTLSDSTFNADSAFSACGGIDNTGQLYADDVSFQKTSAGPVGGGALCNGPTGTATFENSAIGGVSPFIGGAIVNSGNLQLNDSTVNGSRAKGGGAISNDGTLTISSSTLSNNTAADGGAIQSSGTLVIDDSTLMDNLAQDGGAIESSGSLTLTDSTLSGNVIELGAGGAMGGTADGGALDLNGDASILGSTVSDNTGPQISSGQKSFQMAASIVADTALGSSPAVDCQSTGAISDLGYNLTDDTSCGLTASTDVTADPELGSLGPNGGPTLTALPASGSPALGVIPVGTLAGSTQLCGRVDQRGVASTGSCTIGAVEVDS
jgi:predicted outer membrane repeat protein